MRAVENEVGRKSEQIDSELAANCCQVRRTFRVLLQAASHVPFCFVDPDEARTVDNGPWLDFADHTLDVFRIGNVQLIAGESDAREPANSAQALKSTAQGSACASDENGFR